MFSYPETDNNKQHSPRCVIVGRGSSDKQDLSSQTAALLRQAASYRTAICIYYCYLQWAHTENIFTPTEKKKTFTKSFRKDFKGPFVVLVAFRGSVAVLSALKIPGGAVEPRSVWEGALGVARRPRSHDAGRGVTRFHTRRSLRGLYRRWVFIHKRQRTVRNLCTWFSAAAFLPSAGSLVYWERAAFPVVTGHRAALHAEQFARAASRGQRRDVFGPTAGELNGMPRSRTLVHFAITNSLAEKTTAPLSMIKNDDPRLRLL